MIVGHEALRAELEENLPPVTLLLGPPSVGKYTLAQHLAQHHGLAVWGYRALTAAMAREIVEKSPLRLSGRQRAVVIGLDGATETAQNILLKVLEEPPAHVRFILLACLPPLPTVMSRAQVRRLGFLSTEQVADILVSACGITVEDAAEVAAYSRGQVAPALNLIANTEGGRTRSVVAAAVKAARDGGGSTLELALRSWTSDHTALLRMWAEEAASNRWIWFNPSFAPNVTRNQARRIVQALARHTESRNSAAVALAAAFSEER